MTTDTRINLFPGSEEYDQFYYGVQVPVKANYTNYSEHSQPHWARPLAHWIQQHGMMPVLDIGCAYGHLVRELNALGVGAFGIEWSKYAWQRRVHPNIERQDARRLSFANGCFGTVVSLDLLEHFEPADTLKVIDEMLRVAKSQALFVHVIGAHNPNEDISRHLEDPTHANHEPLEWYVDAFRRKGAMLDEVLTQSLQHHPIFSPTDWAGRIVAMRRG